MNRKHVPADNNNSAAPESIEPTDFSGGPPTVMITLSHSLTERKHYTEIILD